MEEGLTTYLDSREVQLIETLAKDYQKFIEPNTIQKKITNLQEKISDITPEKIKKISTDTMKKATEWEVIKKVMEKAGQGFYVVQENVVGLTLDKNKILRNLQTKHSNLIEYEEICSLRSYTIEKIVVKRRKSIDLPSALVTGGVTGFFGVYGLPFNLALTFLMYFRSVQAIGMYYGYDVIEDPRELEFASSVTFTCLSPNKVSDAENLSSFIGQMMLAANVTALTEGLKNFTYQEMAEKGGSQLLYVQIRALANKKAQKALEKAGEKGLEAGIFKNLLEQLGKSMTKETGKKAVPLLGAIIGAFSDTNTMNRIIKGANLIYHKRFLFEKNTRVELLKKMQRENMIIDYVNEA